MWAKYLIHKLVIFTYLSTRREEWYNHGHTSLISPKWCCTKRVIYFLCTHTSFTLAATGALGACHLSVVGFKLLNPQKDNVCECESNTVTNAKIFIILLASCCLLIRYCKVVIVAISGVDSNKSFVSTVKQWFGQLGRYSFQNTVHRYIMTLGCNL